MSELEIKFHVQPQQRAGLLKALGNRKLERVALSARYFDTADLLLARHGMGLRLRLEDGRWVQALKATRPDTLERSEHEVDVEAPADADADAGTFAPQPGRHRRSKVGKKLLALLERHDGPALVETWRTDVTRLRRRLRAHGADVEWALDDGVASVGERTRPISELELEWKGGETAGLYAMARDWQARHGLWIDVVSKAARGALLRSGADFDAPAKARPPRWSARDGATMRGDALLRRMVAASLQQILPNASAIADGSRDPEHVHQLRVGLRRLRAAARAMVPFGGELPAGWEGGVGPVFDALGASRDRHVFATDVVPRLQRAGAPGFAALADTPEAADSDALVARLVRGAPFQQTLTALLAFAHAEGDVPGEDGADAPADPGWPQVRRALRKLWRQVLRDAGRFDELPFERRHQVRKRLKRLRYVAEFVAPWFDARAVRAWTKRVEAAQDALGRHVDEHQAAARLEQDAASTPGAWFAVGWLRSRAQDSARDGRRALRRLARATPFWKAGPGR